MKLTKMFFGGAMLMAVSSASFAQGTEPTKVTPPAQATPDMQAGLVTVVNRMDGSVVIEPTQSAQANDAAAKAAAEKAAAEKAAAEKLAAAEEASSKQFKINKDLIDNVHVGDRVKFSTSETDNAKTITKIEAN